MMIGALYHDTFIEEDVEYVIEEDELLLFLEEFMLKAILILLLAILLLATLSLIGVLIIVGLADKDEFWKEV